MGPLVDGYNRNCFENTTSFEILADNRAGYFYMAGWRMASGGCPFQSPRIISIGVVGYSSQDLTSDVNLCYDRAEHMRKNIL